MTTIAAVTQNGRVHMGADTGMSDDGELYRCASKLFIAGAFIVGYCGSTEYCHALRFRLKWPDKVADLEQHMAVSLPDALRDAYTRAGLDIATAEGGALIGCAGRLWCLDDYGCEAVVEPYAAVGSGGMGARCVLAATGEWGPRKRLQRALEATAKHRADVVGPFDYLTL